MNDKDLQQKLADFAKRSRAMRAAEVKNRPSTVLLPMNLSKKKPKPKPKSTGTVKTVKAHINDEITVARKMFIPKKKPAHPKLKKLIAKAKK